VLADVWLTATEMETAMPYGLLWLGKEFTYSVGTSEEFCWQMY